MGYFAKYGSTYQVKLLSEIEGLEVYANYRIDSLGLVWRLTKVGKWVIMKPSVIGKHKQVTVSHKGKRRGLMVAKLRQLAFDPLNDFTKFGRKLNRGQVVWLVEQYSKGFAIKAIARALQVTTGVVYQVLRRETYTDYTQGLDWSPLDGSQYRKVYNKARKPSDWY